MKMPTFLRYTVSVAGIAALLAGCSSAASSPGVPGGLASSTLSPTRTLSPGAPNAVKVALARALPPGAHIPDVTASKSQFHPHLAWAAPDIARMPRLLFVSDYGLKSVGIYTMPKLVHKAEIPGFTLPFGECADHRGNIWVVDNSARNATRWDRNGTMTAEVHDKTGYPYSCAVDPTTGNLALINIFSAVSLFAPGSVDIFFHARGDGEPMAFPGDGFPLFGGYDTSGDLWVDGTNPEGGFILAGCTTKHVRSFGCSAIPTSGGTIYTPGFVQYAVGLKEWFIADGRCGGGSVAVMCVYPLSASGALGKPITFIDPAGHSVCAMYEGEITGARSKVFVGGVFDQECGGVNSVAGFSFPGGGRATHSNDGFISEPFGAAISMK